MAVSTTSTKTYTIKAGGLTRTYEVIAPVKALPKSAPVIVVLAGLGAKISTEIARDEFVPYVGADKAELVYPVGLGATWNAIGCCGYAWTHRVNDLAFLTALMAKVNPGHARPSYLVGYSNGARLAYRVACTTPSLYNGYGMVKGGPEPDCVVRKPTTIIQLASLDDPEVAYRPGGKSREPIAVTTEVARLHAALKCPAKSAVAHPGNMVSLLTWSGCANGTRLALATWKDGKHSFPRPPTSVPAASQVIWSFFTKKALAPLP
jgi:polyhydroxybutyrate depolymerase